MNSYLRRECDFIVAAEILVLARHAFSLLVLLLDIL